MAMYNEKFKHFFLHFVRKLRVLILKPRNLVETTFCPDTEGSLQKFT